MQKKKLGKKRIKISLGCKSSLKKVYVCKGHRFWGFKACPLALFGEGEIKTVLS